MIPTVQPSWRAWATIWSVVCFALGRRIFGMASISSTVSKSFIPIGVVLSRRRRLKSSTIWAQLYDTGSAGWLTISSTSCRWPFFRVVVMTFLRADRIAGRAADCQSAPPRRFRPWRPTQRTWRSSLDHLLGPGDRAGIGGDDQILQRVGGDARQVRLLHAPDRQPVLDAQLADEGPEPVGRGRGGLLVGQPAVSTPMAGARKA